MIIIIKIIFSNSSYSKLYCSIIVATPAAATAAEDGCDDDDNDDDDDAAVTAGRGDARIALNPTDNRTITMKERSS